MARGLPQVRSMAIWMNRQYKIFYFSVCATSARLNVKLFLHGKLCCLKRSEYVDKSAQPRCVLFARAVGHVAERITELYWESEPPTFDVAEKKIQLLTKGTDLTSQNIIELLLAEWPSNNNVEESISKDHTESSRLIIYHILLQSRLKELDKQRQTQQQKHAQFESVQRLIAPFKDAREYIQPNLVSEDGELGREW
ncbi:hypothetical protein MMC22_003773 [Lobaria immixta]|nr:hypothetical protein [Lobaria immixta]